MEEDVRSNKHLLIVSWLVHLNERSIEFSLQLIAGNGTYRIFYLLFYLLFSRYTFLFHGLRITFMHEVSFSPEKLVSPVCHLQSFLRPLFDRTRKSRKIERINSGTGGP